ncbi:MAG: hypothetical protein ABIJ17_04030 [Patescibacteria group bacterium]
MISDKLIKQAKELVYSDAKKFGVPVLFHIDLANKVGQELVDKLNADKKIVLLGTLLMDCMIGQAIDQGKLEEHTEMSAMKAEELLSEFADITKEEKENVIQCVKQHHGSDKFYSIESKICCNADCYRFLTVKGIVGGMLGFREKPMDGLVDLFSKKVDEKWSVLSLDICKKELESEYKTIKEFLSKFNK